MQWVLFFLICQISCQISRVAVSHKALASKNRSINAVRRNPAQSGAIRRNPVQSGAIRCNPAQSGAIHCIPLHSATILHPLALRDWRIVLFPPWLVYIFWRSQVTTVGWLVSPKTSKSTENVLLYPSRKCLLLLCTVIHTQCPLVDGMCVPYKNLFLKKSKLFLLRTSISKKLSH